MFDGIPDHKVIQKAIGGYVETIEIGDDETTMRFNEEDKFDQGGCRNTCV